MSRPTSVFQFVASGGIGSGDTARGAAVSPVESTTVQQKQPMASNYRLQAWSRTFLVAATLFSCVLSGSESRAELIYDNLNEAHNGGDSIYWSGPIYLSFSTGAGGGSLTKLTLRLSKSALNPTATTTIGLYADSATSPGSLLASIGTVDNSLFQTYNLLDVDLVPGTPFALTANTRYWIGASTTSSSTLAWERTGTGGGVGVAGEYTKTSGYFLPTSTIAFQMAVNVETSAIPEPSSYVLALVGLAWGGCSIIRRRQPV